MCPSFIIQVILCFWIFIDGELTIETRVVSASPNSMFVDLSPGKFQSRNVLKLDSSEKRVKRGKTIEKKPSVILEFNPEFFSSPLLKNLYAALTGTNRNKHHIAHKKTDISPLESNGVIVKPPLKLVNSNNKRDISSKRGKIGGKDPFRFHLTIRPEMPKHGYAAKLTNKTCDSLQNDEQWCATPVESIKCPAIEPTVAITTTCHPTAPPLTNKPHFCGANWKDHAASRNPCDEVVTIKESPTEYVACVSSLPPTGSPTFGEVSTMTCGTIFQTTYVVPPQTTTVPITQKCDNSRNAKLREKSSHLKPERYVLLLKRSPRDSWSDVVRKKRLLPRGKRRLYKFKLEPIKD